MLPSSVRRRKGNWHTRMAATALVQPQDRFGSSAACSSLQPSSWDGKLAAAGAAGSKISRQPERKSAPRMLVWLE